MYAIRSYYVMEENHDQAMPEPTQDMMMDDSMSTPEAMLDETTNMSNEMLNTPNWFAATLTDARTGNAFSINDFQVV